MSRFDRNRNQIDMDNAMVEALQQQLNAATENIHQLNAHIANLQRDSDSKTNEIQRIANDLIASNEQLTQTREQLAQAMAAQQVIPEQGAVQRTTEDVLKRLQTPSVIKELPCFDGTTSKLHGFVKAIDVLMPELEAMRGTTTFSIWQQCIRAKVIGEADNTLAYYGTGIEWAEIKATLITHYSDKRDQGSLTRDMFLLKQTGSIEEFYGKITHTLSLLANVINLTESNPNFRKRLTEDHNDLGLRVFLAGLKEPLGPIIRAQKPQTLKEALRYCQDETNIMYTQASRSAPPPIPSKTPLLYKPNPQIRNHFQNNFRQPFNTNPNVLYPFQNNFKPTLNPNWTQNPVQNNFRQTFNPNWTQNPVQNNFRQTFNPNPFKNNFRQPFNLNQPRFPPQNFAPRKEPFEKPTPMEVDHSIRSRQVNYMNRPHFHEEESSVYGYEHSSYPDYYQHDYFDYSPEQYSEEQQNGTQHYISTNPSPEDGAEKTKEDAKVDELNFQMESSTRGRT